MTVYLARDHADAMLAAIQAVYADVGDADIPESVRQPGTTTVIKYPYAIVWPLGSSAFDGPLTAADLDADAFPTTQVTFYGSTREQTQWLQDKIRAGIVGTVLTVAGRSTSPVRLLTERPPSRDTTVTPYVWWAVDQYRLFTTPS